MDETYKIAITRLGDRIRVGGMAEVSGFDLSLCPPAGDADHSVDGPLSAAAATIGRRPSGAGCGR